MDSRPERATAEERAAVLAERSRREAEIEWRCSIPRTVSQRVFGAVCLRYGLVIYVRRRSSSTKCVRVPRGFLCEVLWPEFEAISEVVEDAICDAIERVIEHWSGLSLVPIKADDSSAG